MGRLRQISDSDILLAARQTFLEHGPSAAVAQVAERLGVSAAALFQRSGSKAQLMLAALAPGPPPTSEAWARAPERERSVSAQLRDQLLALMIFFQAVVPSLIVLRSAGLFPPPRRRGGKRSREVSPAPVALRAQLSAWLSSAVIEGRIRVRDPSACAEALIGAMEARCFNAHIGGPDYVQGDDRGFIANLVAGLVIDLDENERD